MRVPLHNRNRYNYIRDIEVGHRKSKTYWLIFQPACEKKRQKIYVNGTSGEVLLLLLAGFGPTPEARIHAWHCGRVRSERETLGFYVS